MIRKAPCSCRQTKTLVGYVRAKNPEVRVLLSSAYGIDRHANAVLARGCKGFLQKPFSLEQLLRKMRAILDPKDTVCHG